VCTGAGGVFHVRRVGELQADPRIDRGLGAERQAAAVARGERQSRPHVAAVAVAGDRDARRVHADRVTVGGQPDQHRPAIVERGGKRVLGRQPVIDADHDRAGAIRQAPRRGVRAVQIAQHEAPPCM